MADHRHRISLKIGDELIYAFQFPDRDVEVAHKEAMQKLLSDRLEQLAGFPFLMIDVVAFINKPDDFPQAIQNARERLAVRDPQIADRWASLMRSTEDLDLRKRATAVPLASMAVATLGTKEAAARIKINKLLEAAGWRFFPEGNARANICLELSVKIKESELDSLGEDFERTSQGFIDFLLLNEKGFPFIVLEAKAENKNPLTGKEQARKYARSQNCRFVILSNGNLHYFWDLERGNPYLITSFPTPESVMGYQKVTPNPNRLIADQVSEDYIVLTQRPHYRSEAGWRNEEERPATRELTSFVSSDRINSRPSSVFRPQSAKGKTDFCLKWPPERERP